MPTVIVVDCSLSMSRFLRTDKDSQLQPNGSARKKTYKQQAVHICHEILNHISSELPLEYIALLLFSSVNEKTCLFTRDHNLLRASLNNIKLQDKAPLENLIHEVDALVADEWGYTVPCTVIVVTDGRINFCQFDSTNSASLASSLPLKVSASLHFICVNTKSDLVKSGSDKVLQSAIAMNNGKGSVCALESDSIETATQSMINGFVSQHLQGFEGKLHCGRLKSKIRLFPCPAPRKVPNDITGLATCRINQDLHIVGFLNISDVKSPPTLSRHLILPAKDDQSSQESSSIPSFAVVLHGSLKIEHKVALVNVGECWYGLVSSWADSKKKSNLVLLLLDIGTDAIPWLGVMTKLGPLEGAPPMPADLSRKGSTGTRAYFPVPNPVGGKRSYAQNFVVWTRPTGLQTDIQKLLRSAKKLPEKVQVFYKDLNRLRKAALAFGFHELLEGVASILEKECTLLPGTSHPEATLQLSHAAQELRNSKVYDVTICPLKTDFKYHSK